MTRVKIISSLQTVIDKVSNPALEHRCLKGVTTGTRACPKNMAGKGKQLQIARDLISLPRFRVGNRYRQKLALPLSPYDNKDANRDPW